MFVGRGLSGPSCCDGDNSLFDIFYFSEILCQCSGIIAVTEYLLNTLLFTLEGYVWGDLIAGEADNGGTIPWRRLGES